MTHSDKDTLDETAKGPRLTYADAGVDIDAGNALVEAIKPDVKSTARPGADVELGGFGGLFDLKAAGFSDPILVCANDGVGTKLKVAIEAGRHDSVGIDLVAMCVNDLVVQGAEPLLFLDYYATGQLDVATGREIVSGIAAGCRQAGAALIGGETAEMPGLYAAGDYDLAGFAVGAAERGTLLPASNIQPGDVVLGLGSSGLHSNGFSLVRRIVDLAGLDYETPAPFDNNKSLGQALLEPTRIYVRSLLKARLASDGIKALAHITGGGFIENLPRVLPDTLGVSIDLDTIEVPPVFGWLQSAGGIEEREMLRTFNCGIGMCVIVSAAQAEAISQILGERGETVVTLGHVEAAQRDRVHFKGALRT